MVGQARLTEGDFEAAVHRLLARASRVLGKLLQSSLKVKQRSKDGAIRQEEATWQCETRHVEVAGAGKA